MNWLTGRTGYKFDPRDVRYLTPKCPLITVQAPNAAGKGARPQLIHILSGTPAMDIVAVEGARGGAMTHPAAQYIQRDPALNVVSGECVPETLDVVDWKPAAPQGGFDAGE